MERLRESLTTGSKHGFEKEGIRVTQNGTLSLKPHPSALGSSLMHPYITTDFTEPQLELKTSPKDEISRALQDLREIHIFTSGAIGNELIWPFSMPPGLPDSEADIPLAAYGNSARGMKKTVYRRGIGFRYGRKKLTISGVHYNFSMDPVRLREHLTTSPTVTGPLSISDVYFHIIRNLYRKLFLLTYLFGASPAFDKSFEPQGLSRFRKHKSSTYYGRHATSFRASDIGYTSSVQDGLPITYDSPEAYIKSLDWAVSTSNPDYLKFSGRPSNQLNPNYLQAEYELYAPFRPRPLNLPGKRQLDALKQNGVGYLELRLPDLDPEYPTGIDPHAMGFLHLVMMDCLINESPPLSAKEKKEIDGIHQEIIWNGRKNGITVLKNGEQSSFHDFGKKYCMDLYGLAEIMDQGSNSGFYRKSVSRQFGKCDDPEKTPSSICLSDLLDNNKEFVESGMEIAEKNARFFKRCIPDSNFQKKIKDLTIRSIELQGKLQAISK